jgi:hypothetical protein
MPKAGIFQITDFSQDYSWVGKMFPIFVLLTAHFRFQDYEYVRFQPLALLPQFQELPGGRWGFAPGPPNGLCPEPSGGPQAYLFRYLLKFKKYLPVYPKVN